MATVAENRGRPNVYKKYYGDSADKVRTLLETAYSNKVESARGKADAFYQHEAMNLLMDNDRDAFIRNYVTPKGNIKYASILIQIGRAYMQDGYPPEFCVSLSDQAIQLIHEGEKVHQIAQAIRNQRIMNKVENTQTEGES